MEKFKLFFKKYKKEILFLFGFALIMLFYKCPIKFIFGIDCPGCGMSRAFLALCLLDFKAAHDYHPIIFIVAIEAAYYVLTRYIIKKDFGKKNRKCNSNSNGTCHDCALDFKAIHFQITLRQIFCRIFVFSMDFLYILMYNVSK